MLTNKGAWIMPTINLTNNTGLNLNASSADDNATLNRYLLSLLTFKTPPSFDPIANLLVKDQSELDFPITLSAAGEGKFAVEKTTLDIQLGASASIGLLQDIHESDFLTSINLSGNPAGSGIVSFALQGTLSAGDSATVSDFTFGIADKATVTLTSYYAAAANDKLGDAVERAVAALSIPHDLADLGSLPAGAICRIEAASSLTFAASVAYNFLNDPLAAASLTNLPALSINATAAATIEGTATHTGGHILTIAKLPNGLLHLAVNLKKIDDFETSLTVSAGVAADIGTQDALAFLLARINPNAAAEANAIAAQMKDAAQFKFDIRSAIEKSLSTSLGVSLKAALEHKSDRNRAFVFEIDLNGLDDASKPALKAALKGDFTALTKDAAQFKGVKSLDSALTVTAADTHTFALHFLGIFNASSIHEFVAKSKIDFTSDTHELVLSDETLQVVDNNLDAEKLRKLVLKDITLTLPASANTPDIATPITLAFLDREASASPSQMRQFVNTLEAVGAPNAGAAQALLNQKLHSYGACSLFLGLNLDPAQCRELFLDANGKSHDWTYYLEAMCAAERVIYAGLADDAENGYHLRLFNADPDTWAALQEAGSAPNTKRILKDLGMSDAEAELAVTDAFTAIWWSEAMADYSKALAKHQSLTSVGKEVVKESNLGYNEPWMILTTWNLAGKPTITASFISSLPQPALGAH
jgi:hypothetical protein